MVQRPRLHLIRFHGVLATNAELCSLVLPLGPLEQQEPSEQAAAAAECEVETALAWPGRIS